VRKTETRAATQFRQVKSQFSLTAMPDDGDRGAKKKRNGLLWRLGGKMLSGWHILVRIKVQQQAVATVGAAVRITTTSATRWLLDCQRNATSTQW